MKNNNNATQARYEVKCDDCKQTIGHTDLVSVSAAGGCCDDCARLRYDGRTVTEQIAWVRKANPVTVAVMLGSAIERVGSDREATAKISAHQASAPRGFRIPAPQDTK